MTAFDIRLGMFLLWGGGTFVIFLIVFLNRLRKFRHHRNDRRAMVRIGVRRDVVSGGGLLLTALGSMLAVALVLFGEAGTGLRGFAIALALGAFTGAGLVMASEEDADGEAPYGRSD